MLFFLTKRHSYIQLVLLLQIQGTIFDRRVTLMRNFRNVMICTWVHTRFLDLCECVVAHCLFFCPSFDHCVCFSIYGFWLPLWYLKLFLCVLANKCYSVPNVNREIIVETCNIDSTNAHTHGRSLPCHGTCTSITCRGLKLLVKWCGHAIFLIMNKMTISMILRKICWWGKHPGGQHKHI